MQPVERVVRISPKGQITLPKEIRDLLHCDLVRIVANDEAVRIEPVRDLAGSLSQYAKPSLSPKEARETAWAEAMREKHPRR